MNDDDDDDDDDDMIILRNSKIFFSFVEFTTEDECQNAIEQKNEKEFNGSLLRVVSNNENPPKRLYLLHIF